MIDVGEKRICRSPSSQNRAERKDLFGRSEDASVSGTKPELTVRARIIMRLDGHLPKQEKISQQRSTITGVKTFAACGGAAIYRRKVFDEIGLFDERHFAYLEDIDIGYRARLYGYVKCI